MNPFYELRIYVTNVLVNSFSFLIDNSLMIEFCVAMFMVGLILGFLFAWYKYFWKHFLFRG